MPKLITPLLVTVLLAGLPALGLGQNCPEILDCPNNNVVICDISTNDSTFWHASPYTWYPTLNSPDLPESSADINLKVLDDCPGILTIRFTLFLDLDGDNLAESVLTSAQAQALPAGKMLFGNAFTPGYPGVDTLAYDTRQTADSLKFRFVVQTQQTGDTIRAFLRWATDFAPTAYLSARLPEGKHRILWAVEKNGLEVAFCEQSIKVKDCMAPQIQCLESWNASMPGPDTLWLSILDFLKAATDNITPDSLLEFGLRRPGTGIGFPVNGLGEPITTLPFTCADLGLQFVELWARDLSANNSVCAAEFVLYDFLETCSAVEPIVCAKTIFVNYDTIQNVHYSLETIVEQGLPPIELNLTELPDGCVMLPDFSPYLIETAAVTPHKNDDPLNGVSTFDLVLINRHILGIQLFDKTWKYLAADANNSGTLSTLDIIELRKLILGLHDSLPNSTSWKFIIGDCALDSINPFQFTCPGTLLFDPDAPPEQYLFLGIKTGDVNGNASPDSIQNEPLVRSPVFLRIPDRDLAVGEIFELPIAPTEPVEWIGCQWALAWDPDLLEITGATPGAFSGSGLAACALPRPGALRFNWFHTAPSWLFPDMPLLRIQGKAKAAVRLSAALQMTQTPLRPEAYPAMGIPRPLALEFESTEMPAHPQTIYPPQPNPTSSGTQFPIHLDKPADGVLELWSSMGQLVFQNSEALEAGAGKLEIPAGQLLTPGVYTYRIQVGNTTKTGRLVCL